MTERASQEKNRSYRIARAMRGADVKLCRQCRNSADMKADERIPAVFASESKTTWQNSKLLLTFLLSMTKISQLVSK